MPYGWIGKILWIDLTRNSSKVIEFDGNFAKKWLGGRGFAIKILWDYLEPGTSPLSPKNLFIVASGPLTATPVPSSGKLVIASKSPLTGGYGDGNIGCRASVELKKAGYDVVVITGKANKPSYIVIEDNKIEIRNAEHLWGLKTDDVEKKLKEELGREFSILTIGPAGENLVKFSTVISELGRSAGRPGMGAVMGSKNLKAIAIHGTREIPIHDPKITQELLAEGYSQIKSSPGYNMWLRQGTMATVVWANKNSCLPSHNFSEGIYEFADKISGDEMEKFKIRQKGCPYCNMPCGNIMKANEIEVEVDYENIAMLGSNIGMDHICKAARLNRLADEMGMDTISLGGVLAFAMEASDKKLIDERIEWGDFKAAYDLALRIARRDGLGNLLAEGSREASRKIGKNSEKFAMQVKGLEISAYDCHAYVGMALAYGTSPIGAHHKDAWFISWEIKMIQEGKNVVSREGVEKLVLMQNIRGGLFESLTTCRLPWIELGYPVEKYSNHLKAITGVHFTMEELYEIAKRIYTLMRAFWIREYVAAGTEWSKYMDYVPRKWFEDPLTKGPLKGAKLYLNTYDKMLQWYYEVRGWDERGIPRKSTMRTLGLSKELTELEKFIKLKE
ncbi:MAG: aldehyde ferredoxin oxidoreductase [Thermoprotei archaeon]|nr:MAG: aldehyde ferredoxin oxidoreductase [Thermoprotei archaeon]